MNIMMYLKALFPRLEKSRVLEDLKMSIEELNDNVLPSYSNSSDHFRTTKIKSDDVKGISNIFYRNFDLQRGTKQPNIVMEIYKRIPHLIANATYVEEQIELLMEHDIITEGLTAKKTQLIRSAEVMSFISKFTTELLNYIYVQEALEINSQLAETLELSPASIKYVNSNIVRFGKLLSDYSIQNKDFVKIVLSIPEVILSSKTEQTIKGMYTEQQIDPFNSGLMAGFSYNPIYHIRMIIADWQTNRYNSNREKKKVLELRLLHLKLIAENKNDPKLEEEIIYLQGRIDNLERKMREVEDSLG